MAFKTKITPKWVFIIFFFLELIFVTQILNLNGLSNLKTEPQKKQYKKSAEAILNSCNKLSFRETCYAKQFYNLTTNQKNKYSLFYSNPFGATKTGSETEYRVSFYCA